tara:strand:- start:25 stop:303 length:279 start_codon:yes stop_codon:yes gene_type:complete
MGKKSRKEKKDIVYKSKDERDNDIQEIKNKLNILGLTEDLARITNIFEIMDNFIETGESVSGKIMLPEYKRKIDYIFNSKQKTKSTLNILHT